MEYSIKSNHTVLYGTIESAPVKSHTTLDEVFYACTLSVKRTSGAEDMIPLIVPGKLPELALLGVGTRVSLEGQIRSYNHVDEAGVGHLLVSVFVQDIMVSPDNVLSDTLNVVSFARAAVCKPPVYRVTPFGREICDVILAVKRGFGKTDYIPCIAWGRNARFLGSKRIGDKLRIEGRMQSRDYTKHVNDEVVTRRTYEVSINKCQDELP